MEDPFTKSKLQYNEVFRSNNIQLMNLCYQLGKYWLNSYIQLPRAQSYNKTTSPQFLESDFMSFSPTMKTYHLPDSGGSYISRYRSISSHIKLTLFLNEGIEYYFIYFTTILLDFMAFAPHIISKTHHLDILIHSVEQARKKFKREFKLCASSYKQFKHTVQFVNIIDKVFIMPNIEHISDSSIPSILDNNIKSPSTFYSNEDYEKYFTFKNRKYSIEAEYIENVRTPTHKLYPTLDLVPRSPRDDFYIRYGNESRIHEFLSKYPNRITTWTEDINRSNDIANNNNKPTLASSTSTLTLLQTPELQRPIPLHLNLSQTVQIPHIPQYPLQCLHLRLLSPSPTCHVTCTRETTCNKVFYTNKEATDEPTHGQRH